MSVLWKLRLLYLCSMQWKSSNHFFKIIEQLFCFTQPHIESSSTSAQCILHASLKESTPPPPLPVVPTIIYAPVQARTYLHFTSSPAVLLILKYFSQKRFWRFKFSYPFNVLKNPLSISPRNIYWRFKLVRDSFCIMLT